ncbi:protein lifeguard 1-like isoform X2 [Sceloporus undulatus]|nr:protein lifeguard 1-like isoform X2 [Sceloporus undulatus]XP_042326989.1 protein lifeguard 1-like isoform X2 [Sceloporus undulatus]
MYITKMESSLPICFLGDILYIKYQHPGGDSPEVTNSVKGEDLSPISNQQHIGEKPHDEYTEFPKMVRTARSLPSRGRRPRGARSAHIRRQQMSTLGEEEGPFSDRTVRRAFVRKIYLMLTVQLGFTVGIICLFIYWKYLTIWVRRRPWFCYTLLPAILILAIALACCDHARRKFPLNIILLFIFTVLQGTLLGSIAAFFDAEAVMWAVGATTFITFGLSVFALQTKWDLTITSGVLLILLFILLIFGVLGAIFQTILLRLIYAGVGTLFFGIYLLVDTQLMLGKKHHYRLQPDDYIFAVLNVYIDIINMCLFVLQFIGFMK